MKCTASPITQAPGIRTPCIAIRTSRMRRAIEGEQAVAINSPPARTSQPSATTRRTEGGAEAPPSF